MVILKNRPSSLILQGPKHLYPSITETENPLEEFSYHEEYVQIEMTERNRDRVQRRDWSLWSESGTIGGIRQYSFRLDMVSATHLSPSFPIELTIFSSEDTKVALKKDQGSVRDTE